MLLLHNPLWYTPTLHTTPNLRNALHPQWFSHHRPPAMPSTLTRVQFSLRRAANPPTTSTNPTVAPQCSARPAPPDEDPNGWRVLRIRGDGRCMFRSLAQGRCLQRTGSLLGSDAETTEADLLRGAVCSKLQEKCEDIKYFIEGDFDRYVAEMQQPHTWGGEPELAVAPECVESQIDVYVPTSDGGFTKYSSYGEHLQPPDTAPIPLLFYKAGHYDLLVHRDSTPQARL